MKKQSFLKGSAVLLGMVFVTKALGLVYKIPLTSMLGGSGMSCYSGAFAVFTPVFALAAAGLPSAVCRIVSEQLALGRLSSAVKFRKTAFMLCTAVSLLLTAALLIFCGRLAEDIIHIPSAKYAIAAVSLTILPASMMNVHRGWAEGTGSMTPTAASEIIETAVKLVLGLSLPYAVIHAANSSYEKYHGCFGHYCADKAEAVRVSAPFAAAASGLGVAAASWIALVFLSSVTRKNTPEPPVHPEAPVGFRRSAKRLLSAAVPASLMAAAATLTSTVDLMTVPKMLERLMTSHPGYYPQLTSLPAADRAGFIYGAYTGLALTVFGLAPTFTAMLGKSVLPQLSVACAEGDTAEVRHSVRSVLLLSSAIAMPAGAFMCLFSGELLKLLFAGSPTEAALCVRPLAFLGIAAVFMGVSLPCLTALQACDKQVSAVMITLAATVVKLLLNVLLIPDARFGLSGAAAATAVSQGIVLILTLIELLRGTGAGVSCLSVLFLPVLPTLFCVMSAKLCQTELVEPLGSMLTRFGSLFSFAIGVIVYCIMLLILYFSGNYRSRICAAE